MVSGQLPPRGARHDHLLVAVLRCSIVGAGHRPRLGGDRRASVFDRAWVSQKACRRVSDLAKYSAEQAPHQSRPRQQLADWLEFDRVDAALKFGNPIPVVVSLRRRCASVVGFCCGPRFVVEVRPRRSRRPSPSPSHVNFCPATARQSPQGLSPISAVLTAYGPNRKRGAFPDERNPGARNANPAARDGNE
jgi:hypothetical protein